MNEEEAVKIFDLVVKGKLLPATLDKLVPLSFIGSAAVSFYKAKVKLMDQLGMTEGQRKATLADGQDAGRMLLDIEARIGELWDKLPEAPRPGRPGSTTQDPATTKKGVAPKEDRGANQRMQRAHMVFKNPGAVDAITKEALDNDDIPTPTAAVNRIRYETEKKRQAKVKKEWSEETTVAEAQYINALEQCISFLPKKPPKHWTETGLRAAKGYATIIVGRLEAFDAL